jgi:hypothetical protein
MSLRWECVVVDCQDPERVAQFWSAALWLPLQGDEDGDRWLEPGEGSPDLLFQEVPEGKVVKNRLHLDFRPDDQRREVARLIGLGAREKDIGQEEVTWMVLADPEDNEFCVLRATSPPA